MPRTGLISLRQVTAKHARFIRANRAMVDRECDDGGRHAKNHVYQHPYFKPRTGKLQAGTGYRVIKTPGGRRVRVRNRVRYAAPIDRGSRPHEIHAKVGGWGSGDEAQQGLLHFYWKQKGRWVSTPMVNHPGNRPYRFPWKATYSAYRITGQSLRVGMAQLATKF